MATNKRSKFTTTAPDGTLAWRTSENHKYTHAVWTKEKAEARLKRLTAGLRAEQREAASCQAVVDGTREPIGRLTVEQYAGFVAACEKRIAWYEEQLAGPNDTEWAIKHWCSRYDLALKAARGWQDTHETHVSVAVAVVK